jgi:hypothetical protein
VAASQSPAAAVELALQEEYALEEEADFALPIRAEGPHAAATRLFVLDLPPGARFDHPTATLHFRPDFTQGGVTYTVRVVARGRGHAAERKLRLAVANNIAPPPIRRLPPRDATGGRYYPLEQLTDTWLDAPVVAGRTLPAGLTVPLGAPAPKSVVLRVELHGLGAPLATSADNGEAVLRPTDAASTYWWGYSEHGPGSAPSRGQVVNYTERRVLHLLEWALREFPELDPERVYIAGQSMGGAGALQLGLVSARHFSCVEASIGQTVARNHRQSRIKQLSSHWGTPARDLPCPRGMSVWDRLDCTRMLAFEPEAQSQYLLLQHGKDDSIIHFGAVVGRSPLTSRSFYEMLEEQRVGYFAVWDEGGHLKPDPVLGSGWWGASWHPARDAVTTVRRGAPFVAFSRSSANDDPGTGAARDGRPFHADRGYAGDAARPGDTGWDGDVAGARNRWLRWDSRAMRDELDRFEVPLFVHVGKGNPPPKPGYPTTGFRCDATLPIRADVTVRRARAFSLEPHEEVQWVYRGKGGTVQADAMGTVTIPQLEVHPEASPLILTRVANEARSKR